jgi:predicted transposase YbfD/YdcC
LGQVKTEEKSNEITAIPKLLKVLALEGCIVTIDAMGCQKAIAKQIIEQDGDYLVALKGNQGNLSEAVKAIFDKAGRVGYKGYGVDYYESIEYRYYIGSIENNAAVFGQSVRHHWGIENSLHWRLDMGFREDESRIRKGYSAENFAVMRHVAINLLKQDRTTKLGVKNKRLKAGWDDDYLEKLLSSA